MSRALFVSDIHISSVQDPKFAMFLRLLDTCLTHKIDQLFLVGDIFDLWIADRRFFTERYAPLIAKIRELKAHGVQIHYFEGNHDLDLRPFWQHKLGVDVHSEAAFFKINGQRFRVEHGDQMDPNDRGYLFLRWLLRTPLLVLMGRYLPNTIVAWIGRRASASSRDYTSQVKVISEESVRQMIRTHAEKAHGENPFDVLVSGHVHVSEDSTHGDYRILNMGTWLKEPMVLEATEDSVQLKRLNEVLQ